MKKLSITKERFEKSRYFKNKYGALEYVSESGKIYKTSKGKILKFAEAKKSTYDGAENALDALQKKLESATEDLERVAELKQKVAKFTLDAINNRKETKAAISALKKAEKDTQHLVDDAKEFAEYLGGESESFFFAVQDHANKTGIMLARKVKVMSQGDGYKKILDKVTDPKLIEAHPQLSGMGKSLVNMLESARQLLIDNGLFEEPAPEKTWTSNIYDQDEEGKMHKVSEGLGDIAKGAWRKIKDGFTKFCSWFTQTFFPKYQVQEEQYLTELDAFLT